MCGCSKYLIKALNYKHEYVERIPVEIRKNVVSLNTASHRYNEELKAINEYFP